MPTETLVDGWTSSADAERRLPNSWARFEVDGSEREDGFSALVFAIAREMDRGITGPVRTMHQMSLLAEAEGVWLDYIGARMGFPRPYLTIDFLTRFGFAETVPGGTPGVPRAGFDQAPFFDRLGTGTTVATAADGWYRSCLYARSVANSRPGGRVWIQRACDLLFESSAIIEQDAAVTVGTNAALAASSETDYHVGLDFFAGTLAAGVGTSVFDVTLRGGADAVRRVAAADDGTTPPHAITTMLNEITTEYAVGGGQTPFVAGDDLYLLSRTPGSDWGDTPTVIAPSGAEHTEPIVGMVRQSLTTVWATTPTTLYAFNLATGAVGATVNDANGVTDMAGLTNVGGTIYGVAADGEVYTVTDTGNYTSVGTLPALDGTHTYQAAAAAPGRVLALGTDGTVAWLDLRIAALASTDLTYTIYAADGRTGFVQMLQPGQAAIGGPNRGYLHDLVPATPGVDIRLTPLV